MDQKRLHVGLITSFITMLIYLDQGHLTWTVDEVFFDPSASLFEY